MARNNKFIKPANAEVEISAEQMLELKRCMNDPVYFCMNYVKIIHPVRGAIPFKLYNFQKEMVDLYKNNDRVIVMSARQTGKSETAAAFLAHFALFNFDKTILIVSNHNNNSMEMISRIRGVYENLPFWLKPGVDADSFNKHELAFDNGCRIVSQATTENSGRGMAISLLYCDELAFVNPRIQEKFWASISPTLSTGGSAIITSTPNGDQGLFAELWRSAEMGIGDFKSLYVPWDAPPGRDETFKQKMIAEQGEQKWKQEFECQFISSEALLISSLFLQQVTSDIKKYEVKKEVQKVKFWDDIKENSTYLVGVDPSTGSGNDFSVITIFSFPELVQVAEYRSNTMITTELYAMIKNLLLFMESKNCEIHWSVENNGVGEGVLALYENDEDQPESMLIDDPKSKRRGMSTTSKNKIGSCITFKQLFESMAISIRSPLLLKELKSFTRHRGSFAAQTGATDDCVSALLIVVRILQELAGYDDTAFEKLYAGGFGRITESEWETGVAEKEYDEATDEDIGVIVM